MALCMKLSTLLFVGCLLILPILADFQLFNKNAGSRLHRKMSQKTRGRTLDLLSFSWSDCGDPTDPGHLTSLSVTPSPMKLPGNITVGFAGKLDSSLQSPLNLNVEVQKKVIVWITVPCIHNVGSCDYEDVCQLLPLLNCPPIFQRYGLPCQCPIASGKYELPPSVFYVDDSALPSFLTDGSYKVTATLSQGKRNIGCLHLEFEISS